LIRQVTKETLPEFLSLARQMHEESTSRDLEFSAEKLEQLIGSPSTFCVMAYKDQKVIGGMLGFITEHYFSKDKKAVESGLYVVPKHRNGMTGVRLIRTFEDWSKQHEAKHIWIGYSTGIGDINRMKDFYKALGYDYEGFFCRKKINV
jgi:GNAT superfamily N-acetyltransferase